MSIDHTIAVLIDADNVSHREIVGLMAEIANYGKASVRRIYGDWTSDQMNGWKKCLLDHSFTPMQQFAYTTGKNATDGAMIIDAMDLLYTGRFSMFCIVSSDSDFTRLAGRIREQGVTVYGFGKRNTVNAFVAACDKFVYFDVLPMPEEAMDESPIPFQSTHATPKIPTAPAAMAMRLRNGLPLEPAKRPIDQAAIVGLKKAIIGSIGDEAEYAYLAQVGIVLGRIAPNLNFRNYGYLRLRDFVEASKIADLMTKVEKGKPPVTLVRLKESE